MSIRAFKNHFPEIEEHVYIDEDAVIIGKVKIGKHSSVWPGAVLRADVNHIHIGEYSNIQDNAVLHVTHQSDSVSGASLTLGDYVTIGHSVTLHGCIIHDFCLIGMNSVVLDNALIPSYVMIGANSLVPPEKKLESGFLYLGSPVKKVRPLSDEEKQFLKYSAQHYVKLKNEY